MLNQWPESEGETPSDRWKWNETIGPLVDRPGREGIVIDSILDEQTLTWGGF